MRKPRGDVTEVRPGRRRGKEVGTAAARAAPGGRGAGEPRGVAGPETTSPGGLEVRFSETNALPTSSLPGSRGGYPHFPERTTEIQRDNVVFEAT